MTNKLAVPIGILVLGTLVACGNASESHDPQKVVDALMRALEKGDMAEVKGLMTSRERSEEGGDGWLGHPPKVTSYQVISSEVMDPAVDGDIGYPRTQWIDFRVSYTVASGRAPYDGKFDDLIVIKAASGDWVLGERRGTGAF